MRKFYQFLGVNSRVAMCTSFSKMSGISSLASIYYSEPLITQIWRMKRRFRLFKKPYANYCGEYFV